MLPCPRCEGYPEGCEVCGGRGHIEISGCPLEGVTADVYELLGAANMAEKGAWPCGGGTLNQTAACLQGVRLVWNENAKHEADRMKQIRGG